MKEGEEKGKKKDEMDGWVGEQMNRGQVEGQQVKECEREGWKADGGRMRLG